jgi:collagenase-like PrtC family protease
MKLSLGPIPYYWPREAALAFYDAVAGSPADVVYLGEVVCSRRHELDFDDWLAIGDRLAAAGKEVVLSTQALTESEGDLKLVRRVVGNGRFRVEANDMGAVQLLQGAPGWIAGPHLNLYNTQSLALMVELGATRWVPPVEATGTIVGSTRAALDADIEVEVFAHGRLPLAFSARCFTARHFNLQKENCEYRCLEFPDGMPLETREGKPFLAANGVQTQSDATYCLVGEIGALAEAGVGIARISPQSQDTVRVLEAWRAAADATLGADAAREALSALSPGHALCNGFWRGRPGMEYAA